MNLRIPIWWVLAVVAAAWVGRWSAPAADAPVATGAGADAKPAVESVDVAPPTRVIKPMPTPPPTSVAMPAAVTPEAPAPGAPTLGFDSVRFLAELPARLDTLAQRAHAGEPRALVEIAEWIDYCVRAEGVSSLARYGHSQPGDLADAAISTYFQQVAGLCEQWIGRHSWLSQLRDEVRVEERKRLEALRTQGRGDPRLATSITLAETLRRRAADGGDPLAEGLTNDRDVAEACGAAPWGQPQRGQQAHWQCVHAAARERLAAIFAGRDPQVLAGVPRILMAMGPRTTVGSEYLRSSGYNPYALEVRWTLVGCRFGLDCGPTGRALRWACALQGACGYAHYRDYAADHLLPPAAMRQIDGQLPRLVALILAGDVDTVLGPPPRY